MFTVHGSVKMLGWVARHIIIFALFSLQSVSLAAAEPQTFPADIKKIIERGSLIVAQHHEDRYPFFYRAKNDRRHGFDVELAADIARNLCVELDLRPTARTFNEVIDLVARGEADLGISELSITLPRALQVLFTEPYAVLSKGLLINRLVAARTNRGNNPFMLCNHPQARIGVLDGTSHIQSASQFCPQSQLVTYTSFDNMLQSLLAGELLAIVSDDMKIKTLLQKHPDIVLHLRMVILEDEPDPLGIAVNPDSEHLLNWLNIYLRTRNLQMTTDSLLEGYKEQPSMPSP